MTDDPFPELTEQQVNFVRASLRHGGDSTRFIRLAAPVEEGRREYVTFEVKQDRGALPRMYAEDQHGRRIWERAGEEE